MNSGLDIQVIIVYSMDQLRACSICLISEDGTIGAYYACVMVENVL